MNKHPFKQISKFATLPQFVLLTIAGLPNVSFAVGIGSQNWGGEAVGGSDPIGGFLFLAVLVMILAGGWTLGRSSIKSIYLPALIGAVPIWILLAEFNEKATIVQYLGGVVIGLPLGYLIRLFILDHFTDFFDRDDNKPGQPSSTPTPPIFQPNSFTKPPTNLCTSPKSSVNSTPSALQKFQVEHTQPITAEERQNVVEYVAQKNAAAIASLGITPNDNTAGIANKIAPPPQQNATVIQNSEPTAEDVVVPQRLRLKPQIAPTFPNLKGLEWLRECRPFYAADLENFGTDLVEFFGRQLDRTHWYMRNKGSDLGYLSAYVGVVSSEDIENFGDYFIDFIKRLAQHYFDDHDWLYAGRFKEPITRESDVESFGADLVTMVDKVISSVFATHLLENIRPLPFSVGAKVTHKTKGMAFGTGEILKRNDQYLTVEFPAVPKTLEMATLTVNQYLVEISSDDSPRTLQEALALNPHSKGKLPERFSVATQADKDALKVLIDHEKYLSSRSNAHLSQTEFTQLLKDQFGHEPQTPPQPPNPS